MYVCVMCVFVCVSVCVTKTVDESLPNLAGRLSICQKIIMKSHCQRSKPQMGVSWSHNNDLMNLTKLVG